MEIITIDEKQIYGISVRTTNAQEMNVETAQIGKTWQKFDQLVSVDYQGANGFMGFIMITNLMPMVNLMSWRELKKRTRCLRK